MCIFIISGNTEGGQENKQAFLYIYWITNYMVLTAFADISKDKCERSNKTHSAALDIHRIPKWSLHSSWLPFLAWNAFDTLGLAQ